jgi:hypothetical protein
MGNPAEEKGIFATFLNDYPLLVRSPVTAWAQP